MHEPLHPAWYCLNVPPPLPSLSPDVPIYLISQCHSVQVSISSLIPYLPRGSRLSLCPYSKLLDCQGAWLYVDQPIHHAWLRTWNNNGPRNSKVEELRVRSSVILLRFYNSLHLSDSLFAESMNLAYVILSKSLSLCVSVDVCLSVFLSFCLPFHPPRQTAF